MLNDHRGLNYFFTVTDTNIVQDAATVGDPTRCLNDSLNKRSINTVANCKANSPDDPGHTG